MDSSLTDETLMNLHVHTHTMLICMYIQHTFHAISSIGYLVMAEDKNTLKFRQSRTITPLLPMTP